MGKKILPVSFFGNPVLEDGKSKVSLILALSLILNLFFGLIVQKTHAAALTEASVRLDRMGAGEEFNTTTGYKILVVAKPASTATEAQVMITYQDDTDTGFVIDSTASNHDTSTTGLPSTYQGETLNAWTSIQSTATSVTDNGNTTDVVYTSGDLTPGTLYGFYIICDTAACVTNPSTGNAGTKTISITTRTSAPATIDTQSVAVDIVTTDSDQVTVTASINSSFNFAIADSSIALGTLTTGAVAANAMSTGIDIDTNAANGWVAWIRSEGATDTLASASSGDAISSTDTGNLVTCVAGSECYTVDVAGSQGGSSTGSLTITTEYDGNGTTTGGVIDTTYEQIAQSTGQASSDTLTLTGIAAISAVNEAATDYTDTWEVIGAGNF